MLSAKEFQTIPDDGQTYLCCGGASGVGASGAGASSVGASGVGASGVGASDVGAIWGGGSCAGVFCADASMLGLAAVRLVPPGTYKRIRTRRANPRSCAFVAFGSIPSTSALGNCGVCSSPRPIREIFLRGV